jgi:hypothetical protein
MTKILIATRRRRYLHLAATVLLLTLGVGSSAQQNAPNPLGQPLLDPSGYPRDDAFIRIPLLPEDKVYADLDGWRMKQMVRDIVAISLKDRDSGALFWGRNMGFPGHEAMQDWVEARFRANGLTDIRRRPLDLEPQWVPKSYEITFTAGGKTINLKSGRPAAGTASTPPGGLDLELVWVATGTAADFAGRDVKGKAVLIQDVPLPGTIRHSIAIEGAVQRAFDKGAVAIGVVYGLSDNLVIWDGTDSHTGFNLGFADGKVLRDLLGEGQSVRVKYRLDSEMRPGLKTAAVLGTLPGRTDENIYVIAHIDGFFQGALDNASGVAVMMGLLEHYAKIPQAQRRRTITFLGSAGHHSNSGGAGGPGLDWLHEDGKAMFPKTALMINLEHSSAMRTKYWGQKLRPTTAVSPMRWWVWGSKQLLDITLKSYTRFNVGITADMDPGASGEMGSIARNAPSIQVISSPEVKHAEDDTPEWVPAAGLEQLARAYAKIIDDVNKLDRKDLVPKLASTNSASAALQRNAAD